MSESPRQPPEGQPPRKRGRPRKGEERPAPPAKPTWTPFKEELRRAHLGIRRRKGGRYRSEGEG